MIMIIIIIISPICKKVQWTEHKTHGINTYIKYNTVINLKIAKPD